ncbi:MAG: mechanosensitive ion channel family protein, partial [Neisseria sp.]|nr:mechanosensitive ion channel family protein [Neisseria sp.]
MNIFFSDLASQIASFFMSGSTRSELVLSVLWVLSAVVLRIVIVNLHFRRHPDLAIEKKRRWVVTSR